MASHGAGATWASCRAVSGWDAYSRLGDIRAPTLVIHGENDRLIPCANAHVLAARIAHAQLALIPGAGHVFWTDQPDRSS